MDLGLHAVYASKGLPGDHALGRPLRGHPPTGQRDQPVARGGGQVQVVEHGQDRPTLLRQTADRPREVHHVADVEVRGGLVQKEHRGILGQGLGQDHQLPLTAGQFVH